MLAVLLCLFHVQNASRVDAYKRRSGGGGGTRGPSVVDKRNVELECPHCDRSFKQVMLVLRLLMPAWTHIVQGAKLLILTHSACMQIQRFREHIQKKHADVSEADGDASAALSSVTTDAPSAEKPQVSLSTASQRAQIDFSYLCMALTE